MVPFSQWPALSYNDSKLTIETLHLFTQVVGKIKLAKLPWVNHSWHVVLLVSSSGFTTGNIPDNGKHFQIDIDLCAHVLRISTSDKKQKQFNLSGLSVADFYSEVMKSLNDLDIHVKIRTMPNEIPDAIPFDKDHFHKTYNAVHAEAMHHALLNTQEVFNRFRAGFTGKCSPVHFFWGGFDMAVSRFSGRTAPKHPGGIPNMPDRVAQEAYSHEVYSCGFWFGNDMLPEAAFYAYIYPEPEGFNTGNIKPEAAYYHTTLGEYILPYSIVKDSSNPQEVLLDFLHSTYNSAANLAGWKRGELERDYFPYQP